MQVGELKKGINPLSIQKLNFDPKYIYAPIKAGVITAMIALAVCTSNLQSFFFFFFVEIESHFCVYMYRKE